MPTPTLTAVPVSTNDLFGWLIARCAVVFELAGIRYCVQFSLSNISNRKS
jgi:hypothetical protein